MGDPPDPEPDDPGPAEPRGGPAPRRTTIVRFLSGIPGFETPRPELEQVATPPEAAAILLHEAYHRGDLVGRSVADLGCGTGRLAIGAAWLGASSVVGWESDPRAVELARRHGREFATLVFELRPVEAPGPTVDTVLMNPPFGAQRRHADRPFWAAAFSGARRSIYAFALVDSRSFIERQAVEHSARIEDRKSIDWSLPATFRHHRKPSVRLAVDLWVLRRAETE